MLLNKDEIVRTSTLFIPGKKLIVYKELKNINQ
jgi:hypothetical protein